MPTNIDIPPTSFPNLSPEEMEWHFNPRVTVPHHDDYMKIRIASNEHVLEHITGVRDLRYGPNPREMLDIYPAATTPAPVQVYIHGGYWRAGSKDDWAFVAAPFVDRGATVVILGYDLCPTVSLDELVAETRRALIWLYQNITSHGGDRDRIFISGNSAGAHLCAMLLGQDWTQENLAADLIKGAVLTTGIYDIRPVLEISVNNDIRLDPESAHRNSPMLIPPLHSGPLTAIVGGNEAEGWQQQTRDYVAMCRTQGINCDAHEIPGEDHFSLGTILSDEKCLPTRVALSQMGLIDQFS